MAENIDLQLDLDAAGFVQGATQASQAAAGMGASFTGAERGASALSRILRTLSPGRVFTAAAVTSAAAFESQLSGMQATAAVTGQSMQKLQGGMADLARTFPVGNKGAMEIVSTLQSIGYAGKGQIQTIDQLGRSYTKLGAATGASASVIGRQMTMLSRAFGAADSDTQRFNKMGDSLASVTAKIGGSSSDILQFSKAIAPVARSAGIGQTAVMGISAAFSKMGEDGFAASNAMNKMLMDLNRSVRDGSSEMNVYASILGKTREETEALFKSDPTKLVGDLTSRLGGGDKGSERNLERIGLDGPRTARVLQGLSQQGGIAEAARVATESYGNGAMDRASKAASDGLFDEFTKLRSATEQVTEALGRPFLGALTSVIAVAGAPVRGAAAAANSSAGQNVIKFGVPLAAALAGALALSKIGSLVGFGRQVLLNNQGTQAFTNARLAATTGAMEVPGRPYNALGRLGANMGFGFGQARQEGRERTQEARYNRLVQAGVPWDRAFAQATAAGPSVRERVRQTPRAVMNAARVGRALYQASVTEPNRQLRERDATMRQGQILDRSGLGPLRDRLKEVNASSGPLSARLAAMGGVMKQFATETNRSSGVLKSAMSILRTEAAAATTNVRGLGAAIKASLGALSGGQPVMARQRALSSLRTAGSTALAGARTLMPSPAMLATMGAFAAGSYLLGERGKGKQQDKDWAGASVTGTTDAYRNAMGRATEAAQTFAQQVTSANKAMMGSATTDAQGRTLTSGDQQYAEDTRGEKVRNYQGSPKEIAARINAASGGTLDPQDLKAIGVDLRRQYSEETTNQIMALVGGEKGTDAAGQKVNDRDYGAAFEGSAGDQSGTSVKKRFMRNILGQEGDTGGGKGDALGQVTSVPGKVVTGLAGMFGIGGGEVGGRFNSYAITKEQQQSIEAVREGIGNRYRFQRDNYTEDFAKQDQAQDINKAYEALVKSGGTKDEIAALSKAFSVQLGGEGEAANITEAEAKKAGGFIQAYMKENDWAKDTLKGIELDPTKKGADKTAQDSALTKATDGIDLFGRALSNRAGDVDTALNKLSKAFLEMPGDMARFRAAVVGFTSESVNGGRSGEQVAQTAAETMKRLGRDGSDAYKLARAVFEEAYSLNEISAPMRGSQATRRTRISMNESLINSADSTEQGEADRSRGQAGIQQEAMSGYDQMKQRAMQMYQFQKQTQRANRDFNLQVTYSEADYAKQRLRTEEDFQKSLYRSKRDFDISLAQSEEDYGTSRIRANRDFNIQLAQSEEDFRTGRKRANRDFAKQMRRQNEDAAKSMYDPYKRIQTAAVYDLGTLMVNLGEQNKAIQDQADNLAKVRKLGLTDQTIDQLGLNKSDNAQQLQRVLNDLMSDGGPTATDLNKIITTRMGASATLAGDSSQKDRERAKEDFAQSLADQDADYAKSIARNRDAFARSMQDQEKDYRKSIARNKKAFQQQLADTNADYQMSLARQEKDFRQSLERQRTAFNTNLADQREDLADSTKEIMGDFDKLQSAVQDSLAGKAVDFRTLMAETLQGTMEDTKKLIEKYPQFFAGILQNTGYDVMINPNGAGASYSTNGGDGPGMGYQAQTSVIANNFSGVRVTSDLRPGAITASGNTSYHASGRAVDIAPPSMAVFDWLKRRYPNSRELIYTPAGDRQIKNGKEFHYGPIVARGHYDHIHWAMAKGGVARATPGGVKATLAEAGSNEAVIPLDTRGVAVLAQAMTQYITGPDAQRMLTGRKGDRITYTGNTFIEDHSTRVTGPITVQADDPNAMLRALQAKARAANLTATPTRKSN